MDASRRLLFVSVWPPVLMARDTAQQTQDSRQSKSERICSTMNADWLPAFNHSRFTRRTIVLFYSEKRTVELGWSFGSANIRSVLLAADTSELRASSASPHHAIMHCPDQIVLTAVGGRRMVGRVSQ